jgi:hypothetical protein
MRYGMGVESEFEEQLIQGEAGSAAGGLNSDVAARMNVDGPAL